MGRKYPLGIDQHSRIEPLTNCRPTRGADVNLAVAERKKLTI